jgi:hypothetical protein
LERFFISAKLRSDAVAIISNDEFVHRRQSIILEHAMSETELTILRQTQVMLDERLKLLDAEMAAFLHLDGPERAIESEMWFRREIAKALAPVITRLEAIGKKPSPAPTAFKPSKEWEQDFLYAVGKFIHDEIKPLRERIEQLERAGYKGTHQRALSYVCGSLTTYDGALWFATRDVMQGEIPGRSDGWQLAAKSQQTPRAPTQARTYGT